MPDQPLTILCLASYFKGQEFLRECKRQGCRVFLLTSFSLEDAEWPRESVDDFFYMPDVDSKWNLDHTILGVSHLARTQKIDRIVPLDDFDLETAAALREHLRIPGMGETTTRYFRDKLAMRARARDAGILAPDFVHVLNDDAIGEFMGRVSAPWVLKPRSLAGSIGIQKIPGETELWAALEQLGDRRSFFLLEQFISGDIYHVDTIVHRGQLLFSNASRYGVPPMEVTQGGGVFTTRTLPRDSETSRELGRVNWKTLQEFGLVWGVSHSEFIHSHADGRYYFLETSARVGGANIAELLEAASGINLWAEWAKVEIAGQDGAYSAPELRNDSAGLLVSLARQESPDTAQFNEPEVVWRMKLPWHIGLIIKSGDPRRVEDLLNRYVAKVRAEVMTSQPAPDKPTH